MGLTCHHVVLPSISIRPKAKEWEIYGISPREETNLTMDIPFRLDHLKTIASFKAEINESETGAHCTIKMRLRDPQDFITPLERAIYERTETGLNSTKDMLRKAEEFFAAKSERFDHVYAASGLRQQSPPAAPSVSFDWALISVYSSRLSKNDVSF